MELSISPLAPTSLPTMPPIEGVKLATAACGLKYTGRDDVLLVEMIEGTTVAGALTQSKTASANIDWARKILPSGKARVLLVNAGNANAFNGAHGEESVERIVKYSVETFGCRAAQVYPCATGVIGEALPDNKITDAFVSLKKKLKPTGYEAAAHAIKTTDTFAKYTTRKTTIGDTDITINGIAKGSGMIAPNMATMLAYIFTDAEIPSEILQEIFSPAIDASFNSITVDSDTSTSDTALLFATGTTSHTTIKSIDDPALDAFKADLQSLLIELAQMIVKDGEGASKFITVSVTGAEHNQAARTIALEIGNSPLVKTAIAGEDANWGRIVMAVGKADEKVERNKLTVQIGDATLAINGQLNPDYVEGPTAEYMKGQNIDISVDLGIADGQATIWTCDLTHGYISINADYRS